MSTKYKATHSGSCQICGRLQKLPHGRLSNHGYTKRWGFFNGSCTGSRGLPFEQGFDLVAAAVERVKVEIAHMEQEIAYLKVYEGDRAWVSEYVPHGKGRHLGGYVSRRVTITRVERPSTETGYVFSDHTYVNTDGKTTRIECIPYEVSDKGLTVVVRYLSELHKVGSLNKEISQRNEYVKWQEGRIANWRPAELTPVTQ